MRITDARVEPRRIPIKVPYRIAGHTFETAEMVFLILRDEAGREGYGSCTPIEHLTGDDFEGTARALRDEILPVVLGAEVSTIEGAMSEAAGVSPETPSALAALDMALYDLAAKRRGMPLVKMLGGSRRSLVTSVTVGITDQEVSIEQARRFAERGFRSIKVKIGEDAAADVARLRAIRAALPAGVLIRVDANQGYTPETAIEVARELERLGIELFEQPVRKEDVEGLRRVTEASKVPIVLDESVRVSAHLPPLLEARAGHGANIKLMKCGGIVEARVIDRMLHQAGWRALVGCMDESRASIAAAAHFAAAADSVAWIDLDGHLDLAADPFSGGVEVVDGALVLSDAPGLGVRFEGFE